MTLSSRICVVPILSAAERRYTLLYNYRDAFAAVFSNEATGESVRVVEVVDDSRVDEGMIGLSINAFWVDPPVRVVIDLPVPIVSPVRYSADEGLYGSMVRIPSSRTQHWCHPLLICEFAEDIAKDNKGGPARFRNSKSEDWNFTWYSWYDRVNRMVCKVIDTLCNSTQRPTRSFLQMQFRRGISDLITPNDGAIRAGGTWNENGSNGGNVCSGLPITDECLLYRHMYEVKLGYPDVLGSDELYEAIKHKFIESVDSFCDVCWTSKNHFGREVGRVFSGDAIGFSTGKPMPKLGRALNPLMQIAEVKRVWRENRSMSGWLTFENPTTPPLTAKGIKLPDVFVNRITTLVTAIVDIEGMNVYTATEEDTIDFPDRVEEGETIALDGLLITPSGQRKMKAIVSTPEIRAAEDFLNHKEEWETQPGFTYEEDPLQVEVLADGTPVYNYQYRVSWNKPCRCRFDKVKALVGGVKGVTEPIDQLYTEIDGKVVPIDIVVSERTALSKGARDMFLYPLLVHAGVSEVDPTLTIEQLVELATVGLKERNLPIDGRFPIFASKVVPVVNNQEVGEEVADCLEAMGRSTGKKHKKTLVGHSIVGDMPWVRTCEREDRQSSASKGIRLNTHARLLAGLELPTNEATAERVHRIADFYYSYKDIEVATTVEPELAEF